MVMVEDEVDAEPCVVKLEDAGLSLCGVKLWGG